MMSRAAMAFRATWKATTREKHTLVLLRHGESVWNKENRFTGWVDVKLSEKGRKEAMVAGRLMKAAGLKFDVAFTSVLRRAITTLNLALEEMNEEWLPVNRSWRLNERSYGALAGLNKAETAARYGDEQVNVWRRSYSVPPPLCEEGSEHWPGNDRRYTGFNPEDIPRGESLALTVQRFLPMWEATVKPTILSGKRVIIAAHGNSLRALVKHLDGLSDEDIIKVNIPTGLPLVYTLDATGKPIRKKAAKGVLSGLYLADEKGAAAEMARMEKGE
eukprot:c55308_g1_i1.p1 GENE.c55308_g1_i1~~c55308_g1_i1.p1  ORF type:complete len:274 (+),score=52.55 c55308_g1_i1:36-857(+)